MKFNKFLLGCLLGISSAFFFGFSKEQFSPKPSTAEVNEFNGILIFSDSKPVSEYESLGTITTTFFMFDSQYESVKTNLVKRAKKKFPQANGIILKLSPHSIDKCEVIRIKN